MKTLILSALIITNNLFAADHGEFNLLTTVIFPYANFIMFVIALGWIIKKKINPALTSKRDQIIKEITSFFEAKKKAEAIHKENTEKINNIDLTLKQITDQYQADQKNEEEALAAGLQREIQYINKELEDLKSQEITRAKKAIESEIISKAIDKSKTALKGKFGKNEQIKKEDFFVSSLEKDKLLERIRT